MLLPLVDSVTRTEKALRGFFEVWLCDLSLDAANDGGVSEADECRAVCGRNGADVHEEVAPFG